MAEESTTFGLVELVPAAVPSNSRRISSRPGPSRREATAGTTASRGATNLPTAAARPAAARRRRYARRQLGSTSRRTVPTTTNASVARSSSLAGRPWRGLLVAFAGESCRHDHTGAWRGAAGTARRYVGTSATVAARSRALARDICASMKRVSASTASRVARRARADARRGAVNGRRSRRCGALCEEDPAQEADARRVLDRTARRSLRLVARATATEKSSAPRRHARALRAQGAENDTALHSAGHPRRAAGGLDGAS